LKPNYQFEKRRKALAKKQKQEEKRQRKLEQKGVADSGDAAPAGPETANVEPGSTKDEG